MREIRAKSYVRLQDRRKIITTPRYRMVGIQLDQIEEALKSWKHLDEKNHSKSYELDFIRNLLPLYFFPFQRFKLLSSPTKKQLQVTAISIDTLRYYSQNLTNPSPWNQAMILVTTNQTKLVMRNKEKCYLNTILSPFTIPMWNRKEFGLLFYIFFIGNKLSNKNRRDWFGFLCWIKVEGLSFLVAMTQEKE